MRTVRLRDALTGMVVIAVLAAVLTGCGGSSDGGDASSNTNAGSSTKAPSTVAITHRFGTTDTPVRPKRVVSLDAQWTDVLLAMDAPPVGYLLDYNLEDGFPWRGDRLDQATGIAATTALPYEKIAALEPDLIVVAYFAQNDNDYKKLTAIAPTIATLSASQVDTWQDITLTAGRVLDEPKRAQAVIDDVEGQVAAVATELPGLDGKTFALVNYVPGDKFYVVSDPKDGAVQLFTQLGMSISPTILEAGRDGPGRVELSLERADMLDADLLIVFPNGGDPEDIVGWDQLPAVKSGAVSVLDYAAVSGLNTPSPLSIPYSLKLIRPELERVAAE
jgi:iron complex transport system substrate-binding protein